MKFLGMDYLTDHMASLHAYLILKTNVLTYMHGSMVYMCRVLIFLLPIVTRMNGSNISKTATLRTVRLFV
jgi:hypothetical protein